MLVASKFHPHNVASGAFNNWLAEIKTTTTGYQAAARFIFYWQINSDNPPKASYLFGPTKSYAPTPKDKEGLLCAVKHVHVTPLVSPFLNKKPKLKCCLNNLISIFEHKLQYQIRYFIMSPHRIPATPTTFLHVHACCLLLVPYLLRHPSSSI